MARIVGEPLNRNSGSSVRRSCSVKEIEFYNLSVGCIEFGLRASVIVGVSISGFPATGSKEGETPK